ncbi:helix-turn-helix domain-containing protein [Spirillospora sp. CA-294931]|uniref:helix-turn-helix domain-containing protein n=1 Tax=Spirillospora sp. CA-294931 TaxID=3240042 RepID=UPI003D91C253
MATLRHRRRLGRELEMIRKGLGLSQRDVAAELGWSQPTVGRIEAARTKDVEDAVRQLLDLYRVSDDDRERLLQLALGSPAAGWWTAYNDVFPSSYAALEDGASGIQTWQDAVVPGLLQNEAYARALLTGGTARGAPRDSIERRVQARMLRRTLLAREHPPHLWAVLDESVLRRQIGGPDVMRSQLEHLEQIARQPHVDLRIMPFEAGAHPGLDGRFVILSFEDEDPDVPYIESAGGAVYLEAPGEVERITVTWCCVRDAALSVERSLDLLSRLVKEA